jgi:hypothetical protein
MTVIFYEVYENLVVDGGVFAHELAAMDVTEMSAAERATVLSDLKAAYGESCIYRQHYCGHDEGRRCPPEVEI